jgi:hypothetical protein
MIMEVYMSDGIKANLRDKKDLKDMHPGKM